MGTFKVGVILLCLVSLAIVSTGCAQGLTEQDVRDIVQEYPGAPGPQGIQGEQGIQGAQGIQGEQGIQGMQGQQGELGQKGTQGFMGPTGAPGPQGKPGLQGSQGRPGTPGIDGSPGLQGPQGEQGEQGKRGLRGVKGSDAAFLGPPGPTGPQGPPGEVVTVVPPLEQEKTPQTFSGTGNQQRFVDLTIGTWFVTAAVKDNVGLFAVGLVPTSPDNVFGKEVFLAYNQEIWAGSDTIGVAENNPWYFAPGRYLLQITGSGDWTVAFE